MIKKILKIENMGSFKNFEWDSSMSDGGNNIVEFKKVNIFYGRNYSGKTTLSRIFRAIEKNELPPNYKDVYFSFSDENNNEISQDSLANYTKNIRVFNKDFMKENLNFIYDEDRDIKSFAILGQENTKIQEQINELENQLGSEEEKTGLYGKLATAEDKQEEAQNKHTEAIEELDNTLRNKARNIKQAAEEFGDVNYDIRKIKTDIDLVKKFSYSPITPEKKKQFKDIIKEKAKHQMIPLTAMSLHFDDLSKKTNILVEKEISVTKPIQELLNDSTLQKWVLNGMELHRKRNRCGFCGQSLPKDIWKKLEDHFNEESKNLTSEIESLVQEVEQERKMVSGYRENDTLKKMNYYSNFHDELDTNMTRYKNESEKYCKALELLMKQLNYRKENILKHGSFQNCNSSAFELLKAVKNLLGIIKKSNKFSYSLSDKQKLAKESLRLHEVEKFIKDIRYDKKNKTISDLESDKLAAKKDYAEKLENVEYQIEKIEPLRTELKDESKAAGKINSLLKSHFRHDSLSLHAIEKEDGDSKTYQFEIRRENEKAYNLSEGECSLIAFCYFVASLSDSETGETPLIWIDDPISSLDSNHIFFVYSMIHSEIVKPKKYEQLFIATHNLDFLKYLKRISKDWEGKGKNKKKIREFFLVEKEQKNSTVSVMPRYLKEYATEFNYLFGKIYKCATADKSDDSNYQDFLSFGNNARKFLELFLYYRYPSTIEDHEKQRKFFGKEENIPTILTRKLTNERSHLSGQLERGAQPIDTEIAEIQNVANLILDKIKKYNKGQYNELVKSIGAD